MATLDTIDTTVQKTNALLHNIEQRHEALTDQHEAYQALRAVLTTLRDRLTPQHAHSLGAQLTPLLRGIYYEGWSPDATPLKLDRDAFLETVAQRYTGTPVEPVEELVHSVLIEVAQTIESHELEKLTQLVPNDVAELLATAVVEARVVKRI